MHFMKPKISAAGPENSELAEGLLTAIHCSQNWLGQATQPPVSAPIHKRRTDQQRLLGTLNAKGMHSDSRKEMRASTLFSIKNMAACAAKLLLVHIAKKSVAIVTITVH
jgi:hypothetical protein